MRTIHGTATLAVALMALAAAASTAAAQAPFACTTDGLGSWTVTAFGPFAVDCPDTHDPCTRMEYSISPNNGRYPSHVAVLVQDDVIVGFPHSANVALPCQGDPTTKLGARDCSRKSVKLLQSEGPYEVLAEGDRAVIASSIAVKKGNVTEQCKIASLGSPNLDPNAQLKTSEEIIFKGCAVKIPVDPVTGQAGTATIEGENCVFVANAEQIGAGQLTVNGVNVGALSYGDGAISSGVSSCTTKVISRKIYTWCTCKDIDGDNIPDDPKPPCPPTLPPPSS